MSWRALSIVLVLVLLFDQFGGEPLRGRGVCYISCSDCGVRVTVLLSFGGLGAARMECLRHLVSGLWGFASRFIVCASHPSVFRPFILAVKISFQ